MCWLLFFSSISALVCVVFIFSVICAHLWTCTLKRASWIWKLLTAVHTNCLIYQFSPLWSLSSCLKQTVCLDITSHWNSFVTTLLAHCYSSFGRMVRRDALMLPTLSHFVAWFDWNHSGVNQLVYLCVCVTVRVQLVMEASAGPLVGWWQPVVAKPQ